MCAQAEAEAMEERDQDAPLSRWRGSTWRPRIRQRQWLHRQELSPPADLRRAPRHARPWTRLQRAAAWTVSAVIAVAVIWIAVASR